MQQFLIGIIKKKEADCVLKMKSTARSGALENVVEHVRQSCLWSPKKSVTVHSWEYQNPQSKSLTQKIVLACLQNPDYVWN
jgi:hypothetical protein